MTSMYFYRLDLLFFRFHYNFGNGNVDIFLKVMSRITAFTGIVFYHMMTSTTSLFLIYDTQMFCGFSIVS